MTTPQAQALAELVALKDLKDEESRLRQRRPVRDKEKLAKCDAMREEYARRKPAAWAAARAALATKAEAPAAPSQAVPPIFWVGRISKIAECCDPDIFFGDTEADVREKAGAWNSRYEFYPVCAATPPQAAAPAQADAADDLIHRLHAEANKADDVHADLMREAAEALAATPAQPAPVVQPFTQGQRVRQQATATRYDYATVITAHPNGALDVQADDGTRYGWAAFATELAPESGK